MDAPPASWFTGESTHKVVLSGFVDGKKTYSISDDHEFWKTVFISNHGRVPSTSYYADKDCLPASSGTRRRRLLGRVTILDEHNRVEFTTSTTSCVMGDEENEISIYFFYHESLFDDKEFHGAYIVLCCEDVTPPEGLAQSLRKSAH